MVLNHHQILSVTTTVNNITWIFILFPIVFRLFLPFFQVFVLKHTSCPIQLWQSRKNETICFVALSILSTFNFSFVLYRTIVNGHIQGKKEVKESENFRRILPYVERLDGEVQMVRSPAIDIMLMPTISMKFFSM